MSQKNTREKMIFVAKNSRPNALETMETIYPESSVPIIAPKKVNVSGIISGVRAFVRLGPSVGHAHHAQAALIGGLARCFSTIRLVTTGHNNFQTYRIRHKLAFGIAFVLSDRVICNSEATMASLPSFVRRDKTCVIYNGVDFTKIDSGLSAAESSPCDGSVVIGTVCRMVPQKDLPTLLRGFYKTYHKASVPLRLRLVGDGEQRPVIERLIAELCLHDAVDLIGTVGREEVYRQLRDMDIFVVSSRWEGFCNAMVEAAAAGKAIVVSDIAPLPEVIGRGNATFFKVGDCVALSEKLFMLVNDGARRTALGESASEFVRNRYSLEASAQQYEELYEELAKELEGEVSDR